MQRWFWVPICPGPCLCCCWRPVRRCCICRIIDSPHGIQSSGCPLLLSFGGLEVFRNTDQLSSSWTVYSIALIITLRLFRFERGNHRRKVPLWVCAGVCCKHVPCCVDLEHILRSECVPTPVLCRQAGGMEGKEREGQDYSISGQTSITMHPL